MKWLKRISKVKSKIGKSLVAVGVFVVLNVAPVYAQEDLTSTITEWMPTIITFAMLGMILGLLKKFGKF